MEEIAETSQSEEVTDEMLSAALKGEDRAVAGMDSEEETSEEIAADEIVEGPIDKPSEEEETEEVVDEEPEEALKDDAAYLDGGVNLTEEEKKKRDEENAERSRLGRKVAYLERKVEELTNKPEPVEPILDDYDEDEEIVITKKSLREQLKSIQEEEQQAAQAGRDKYQVAYIQKMDSLAGNDLVEHEAIVAEMVTNEEFNKIYHNIPEVDAELNYLKAKAKIQGTQKVTRKSPLKGGKPSASLAVPGQTKETPRKKTLPKIPDDAKRLMDKMGISEEEAMEALT